MKVLDLYLQVFLWVLGAWVASFEIALYARLGFADLYWLFAALLGLGAALFLWHGGRGVVGRVELSTGLAWLGFGLLLASGVLIFNRPDLDDSGYLARPLLDSLTPRQPIAQLGWEIPYPGFKLWISALAKNAAYDPLAIVLAHWLGGQPITWYHNILPVFLTLAWVAVYVLLLARLGVRGWRLVLALSGAVALLVLDGATHRSFGNFWLLRIWQGKILMIAVLLPLLLLLTWRVLEAPRRRDVLALAGLALIGPFINRSALFLFPTLVACTVLAYLLIRPDGRRAAPVQWRTAAWALLPLLLFAALIVSMVLMQPADHTRVLADNGGAVQAATQEVSKGAAKAAPEAWRSLRRVYRSNPWLPIRDALLLVLVPLLALRGRIAWFIPVLSLTLALVLLSPVTGDRLAAWITDRAYWRVYYLLPLPIGFALLPLALVGWGPPGRARAARRMLAFGVLAVVAVAFERPVLSPQNRGVELKAPLAPRIRALEVEALDAFRPWLSDRRVLAPNQIGHGLQMIDYARVRVAEDRRYPTNQGPIADAHDLLADCRLTPEALKAVEQYLVHGADALITRRCGERQRLALLEGLPGIVLEPVAATTQYELFLVQPSRRLDDLRAEKRRLKERYKALRDHGPAGAETEQELERLLLEYRGEDTADRHPTDASGERAAGQQGR